MLIFQLLEELANYDPQTKSGLLPVFIKKSFAGRQPCLFMYMLSMAAFNYNSTRE